MELFMEVGSLIYAFFYTGNKKSSVFNAFIGEV